MKKIFRNILTSLSILYFSLTEVYAVDVTSGANKVYGNLLEYLLNPLLKFGMVIAFIYFLFGVFKYILAMSNGGTNDEINNGKNHLLWGLVGLFIIFSISGITSLLSTVVGGWFQ